MACAAIRRASPSRLTNQAISARIGGQPFLLPQFWRKEIMNATKKKSRQCKWHSANPKREKNWLGLVNEKFEIAAAPEMWAVNNTLAFRFLWEDPRQDSPQNVLSISVPRFGRPAFINVRMAHKPILLQIVATPDYDPILRPGTAYAFEVFRPIRIDQVAAFRWRYTASMTAVKCATARGAA